MATLFWYLLILLPVLTLATLHEYVVYPSDRRDTRACSLTNRTLFSMGEVVQVTSYASALRGVTEFWLVKADSTDIHTIRGVVGVRTFNTQTTLSLSRNFCSAEFERRSGTF